MKTNELREKYLAFYETKGHARRPSDVLVPTWDPSVLFTPAGMNQFKDHFLGKVKLDFTRATTCQKCLRTGDIDNVGRTAYHHTFFEMLGNFSFGDYFKREAILWAWEFLTDQQWLAIAPERLSVTVYKDDQQAAAIWRDEVGLPSARIAWLGEDENFWPASAPSQGPDGVCGPCSEIFYHPDDGNEVEIWNLVFTQFNRVGNPPDNLRPLPSQNIDTGMGLERTAAVLQGVDSNFHTDALLPIVQAAADACNLTYEASSDHGRRLRRIADHVRACSFAIHENVYPGPNKEKYVIKRLLRRAVLDGHQIGLRQPFLHQIVPAVVDAMQAPYPELRETQARVTQVIQKEESSFFSTIDDGLAHVSRVFSQMAQSNRVMVDGAEAAELYQTYGVPPELFQTLAAEKNFTFDWDGFQQAMTQHGEASGKQQFELFERGPLETLKEALHYTEFLGYETTKATATVKGIVAGQAPHDRLCDKMTEVGHENPVRVVLDRSPFYGESGGQVGDTGTLVGENFEFQVNDVQKSGDLLVHAGHLTHGEISEGTQVTAQVNDSRRDAIRRAHSATHLLHHALQKHVGQHAQQQGSKVDSDWLRFDFTHLNPLSGEELANIQAEVNQYVHQASTIEWATLPLAAAREQGAMMLFGEKYPDPVRMVTIGDYSRELCGGTHLTCTDQVQAFEITSEEAVSAGTRRIVALTGERACQHAKQIREQLAQAATQLAVSPAQVPETAQQLAQAVRHCKKALASGGSPPAREPVSVPAAGDQSALDWKQTLADTARALNVGVFDVAERLAKLQAELQQLETQIASRSEAGEVSAETLLEQSQTVGAARLVVAQVPAANPNLMRQLIDQLRKKANPIAVLLAATQGDNKVMLVAGLSDELVAQGAHAGNWIRPVAQAVGGSGGGKAEMAQAGGKAPDQLPEALEAARSAMTEMLSA